MYEEGLFRMLPNEILTKILKYEGTLNLRCASPSLEKRVSSVLRSKCNKFYIPGINDKNCDYIRDTLATAMAKEQAPQKLELRFDQRTLNQVMKQILLDNKNKVSLLVIKVGYNYKFLLEPATIFESLESLTVEKIWHPIDVAAFEAMLNKHAHNLNHLHVSTLCSAINIPALTRIDHLSLCDIGNKEALRTLYEQSKDTITRLDIITEYKYMSPPLHNDEDTAPISYKVKNLRHLQLNGCHGFKFVISNADNLITLNLGDIVDEDIPNDIEWPEFPRLRELRVIKYEHMPILLKCYSTLECLILGAAVCNTYDLEMPKLTDLYTCGTNPVYVDFICRSNYKSLEFMSLNNLDVLKLDNNMRDMDKMEKMVKVVLNVYDDMNHLDSKRKRLERICPNAEVVILHNEMHLIHHVESRVKSKGFTIDLERYIEMIEDYEEEYIETEQFDPMDHE